MPNLGPFTGIVIAVIAASVLVGFVAGSAVFFIWLERKVAGRIQDRLGPTRVGGKFGWLQTLADGIKLLVKEDIIPADADQMLFRLGPYIAFCGSFLAFLALPFGNGVVARTLNIAVFFMLAVMSTEVFGIILVGYGSGSKWSLFGGMREAAQMVSYEVPMAMCVLVPVIVAGSMNLNDISQPADWLLLELVRLPRPVHVRCLLDLLHLRHGQLQAGPVRPGRGRERTGGRLPHRIQRPALVVLLHGRVRQHVRRQRHRHAAVPGRLEHSACCRFEHRLRQDCPRCRPLSLGNVINVVVFIVKGWVLVFVMMWVRWTLPRLRIDQVMMTCLKYLLPISCVLLLGVSVWQAGGAARWSARTSAMCCAPCAWCCSCGGVSRLVDARRASCRCR